MLAAVELLVCNSIGYCVCPISSNANLNFTASCVFKNRLPSSASTADAAAPIPFHKVWIAPLKTIGCDGVIFYQGSNNQFRFFELYFCSCRLHLIGFEASSLTQRIVSLHLDV